MVGLAAPDDDEQEHLRHAGGLAISRFLTLAWLLSAQDVPTDPPPADEKRIAREAQVVDEHGTPEAGVELWCLDWSWIGDAGGESMEETVLAPEVRWAEFGRRFTSDEAGRVALPPLTDGSIVIARKDDRFAREDIGFLDHRSRIPLMFAQDRRLRVQVIDAEGHARSGVPVAAWVNETSICGNCGPQNDRWWSCPTDEEGFVEVPHAQWFFATSDHGGALGVREHQVGLGFPTRNQEWRTVDPRRIPEQPLELRLPPTGRLELVFELPDGTRCADPVKVVVAGHEKVLVDGVEHDPSDSWGVGQPFGTRTARDGSLSLPFIEAGLDLLVVAESYRNRYGWIHAPIPGPKSEGEHARSVLRFPGDVVRFVGRVVSGSGLPRAGTPLVAGLGGGEIDSTSIWTFSREFRTDSAGRFELNFHTFEVFGPVENVTAIELGLPAECDDLFGRTFEALLRIDVRDRRDGAIMDLGDVDFSTLPLFLGGHLTDGAGRAIAGTDVQFTWPAENEPRKRQVDFMVKTNASGAFTIRAAGYPGRTAIDQDNRFFRVVGRRRHDPERVEAWDGEIEVGTDDLEIVVERLVGGR